MDSDYPDELNRVYETLVVDIDRIFGKSKSLAQWKRRSLLRAFVALIEFDTFNRKRRALYLHDQGVSRFGRSELMLLNEIQPEIDEKGKVKEKKKMFRVIDNYRFAIRMFSKAARIPYELPVNSTGWSDFKETVAMRNRITHPKSESDLEISDEQLSTMIRAYKWFMDNYSTITEMMAKQSSEGQIRL